MAIDATVCDLSADAALDGSRITSGDIMVEGS